MGTSSADVARALGLVYLGGPTVAVVSLLLPHSERTNDTGIWILIAIAYAVVPFLFTTYRRLPDRMVEALIAFAAALVTLLVWFDGDVASEYAFFYLWPIPFAFVYFSLPRALFQLAFAAAAYAVVAALIVAHKPGAAGEGSEATYWLLLVSALVSVGLLVRALAQTLRRSAQEREAERRRKALEINDSILQGLVVAKAAHEQGREDDVARTLGDTLQRARAIVMGLLDDDVTPGDLRRTTPVRDDPPAP
jgi:signal transduction histidine kinase